MALSTPANIGTGGSTSGSSFAITVPVGGVPAGAIIAVAVSDRATAYGNQAVTDSVGNTYTRAAGAFGLNVCATWYYAYNVSALTAGQTITVTKSGTDSAAASAVYITITGAASGSPLDSGATATAFSASSGQPSITSGTPATAGCLMLAMVAVPGATGVYTPDASWTTPPNSAKTGVGGPDRQVDGGYQLLTGTPTKSFNPSYSAIPAAWAAAIIAFKPDIGGGSLALQARTIAAGTARNGAGYSTAIRTQMRALSSAKASQSLSTRIAARSRASVAARARQSLGANLAARASSTGHGKSSTSLSTALQALSRAIGSAQAFIVGPGALAARATAMAGARAAASVSTALTGSAYTAARGFGAIVGPGSLSARAVARASAGASILASVAISATGHAASHSVSIFGAALSIFARSSGGSRGNASADLSTDLRARGAMQAQGAASSSGLIAITGRIFARLAAIAALAFPPTDALPGFIITAKARRISLTAKKRITTLISKFGGPMQQFDPKTPYARMLFAMDFKRNLNEGEEISSATVEIEALNGTDTSAASMLDGIPIVDGTQIKQWVKGGLDGVNYSLAFKAVTSSSAKLEDKGSLLVTENI